MTSVSLCNYYRYYIDDVDVNENVSDGKTFEYKTKIVEEIQERQLQPGNPEDTKFKIISISKYHITNTIINTKFF